MNIITDQTVLAKTSGLIEFFWRQMEEAVEEMEKMLFTRFELELTATTGLHQRTFAKVREKIGPDAIQYFSQPSLFMYRFLTTYMETSEEVKRGLTKQDPLFIERYDPEVDIRETRPQAEHQLKISFETELAYWKAMEEKRYADAKVILSAITLMRKDDKEAIYQLEVINWKLDLAGRTGDIALFLEAIASVPDDAECSVNKDNVKYHLKQLLLGRGMSEIKVAVSLEGRRRLLRESSPIEFLRTQTDIFTNSLLTQVTNGILSRKNMEVHEFFTLVETATKESTLAFLKVHPFITDLIVVWKKS